MQSKLLIPCAAVVVAMTVTATAGAHQTAVNNGVAVQVHVDPNDEPVAGESTTVWVVRVKGKNVAFAWRNCNCRLKVYDSSGKTIVDTPVSRPRTPIVFPEEKAYGITFSGRVRKVLKTKKLGAFKAFRVNFAVRAGSGG